MITSSRRRPDVSKRKAERAQLDTCVIKCGFAKVCHNPLVAAVIDGAVATVTHICFEACKLLNLYLLWRLDTKPTETLPPLSGTFVDQFFWTVSRVGKNSKEKKIATVVKPAASGKAGRVQQWYTEIVNLYRDHYLPLRRPSLAFPNRSHLTQLCQSARNQLLTNAQVSVLTNFERRTKQWIANQFREYLESHPSSAAATRKEQSRVVHLLYVCCTCAPADLPSKQQSAFTTSVFLQQVQHREWACQQVIDTVRQVLGRPFLSETAHKKNTDDVKATLLPVSTYNLKAYWYAYLPWLHIVQRTFQRFNDRKGNRRFTLFPEHRARAKYIHLDTKALQQLVSLANSKRKIRQKKAETKKSKKESKEVKMSKEEKRKIADEEKKQLWLDNFRLDWLPKNRTFAYSIKTDGLSASVTVQRHKREDLVVLDQDGDAHLGATRTVEELEEIGNAMDRKFATERIAYTSNQRIVGLDPGRRDVFVAVDSLNQDKANVIRCSNAEYHTLCGFKRRKRQQDDWVRVDPDGMRSILRNMPSSRVASYQDYQVHLEWVLTHLGTMLQFYGARRQKRLRWATHIRQTQALDLLCQRITRNDPRNTIVAFGAAGFSSSSPGHAPAGRKNLKRRLIVNGARVVDMNEHLTSQVCSSCHQRRLTAPTKVIRVRDKNQDQGATDKNTRSLTVPIHGVRICPKCRIFWNRDVNAARNLLFLFYHLVHTRGHHPKRFKSHRRRLPVPVKRGQKRKRAEDDDK